MGADLITLDDYKLIEGLSSSKDDEKLEALITSVSQLIKTYCANDFVDSYASPGNTEYFDIQWDTYVVQLSKTPVVTITGVFERASQSEAYTEIFRDGNGSPAEYSWYFDSISESIFRTNENGTYKCFPKGVGSVQVNYTSGYATVPEDLKLAIVDTITYYHKDEHKKRQSIGATTRESTPTSTRINDTSFPDHIKRVLDLYRSY